MKHVVRSVAEMQGLAQEVAGGLTGGELLLLYGELGAGKTTFVQGLARALGITEAVTSPTFIIASEYAVVNHSSIRTLVHADLYRLDEKTAAGDPAVQDVLSRAGEEDCVTVVEWADRLAENVPPLAKKILFQPGQKIDERIVTFSS